MSREAPLDSDQHILAEATQDLHWGTGLSPYFTSVTKPEFWPEKMFLVLWRWTYIQNCVMRNLWMNLICLQTLSTSCTRSEITRSSPDGETKRKA